MPIFFIIFFAVYSAVNYYMFLRGWQALAMYPQFKPVYVVLFLVISYSYVAGKVLHKYLPVFMYDLMITIGSFWFAYMLYFIIFLFLLEDIRIINHFFKIYPALIIENYQMVKVILFAVIVLVSSLIVGYGYYNSLNFKVKEVKLTLPKKDSKLNELNAVLLSDVHISVINDEKYLSKIVEKVNALNPDVVLIAGDLVDETGEYLKENGLGKSFLNLKTKYGVYASTGNHEFINGADGVINYLSTCGIKWVKDTSLFIGDGFNIAARNDSAIGSFTGQKRKPLEEVLTSAEKNYPVILLDHTPFNLQAAADNGVDLQLSGHTHHGQLYPLGFITNMVYELSWGYKKKDNTHYYVSSGVGTWGPPVKLGSDAEIVNLKIKFE